MIFTEKKLRIQTKYFAYLVILALACLTACASREPIASPTNGNGSSSPSSGGSPATEWLTKARAAASQMNKYGFELQLNQKIKEQTGESKVSIDMQGRAELNPLKLDQTIKSDIDGEASTLRALLVADAYYMYLPEYEEWSKLSKEVAAENVQTLSAFQIDPVKALQEVQELGAALTAEQDGQVVTIRYEGAGEEAAIFLKGILESTMGISTMDSGVQDSLAVQMLKVVVTMNADSHLPLTYRIESDMTIELEPGHKTVVNQALAGSYTKHNVSAAVTVPKEALDALDPDQIDKQLNLEDLGEDNN
ncbi:DUF6612 family protein [Cohnella abietis]|uniref:Lipoprotein n=1 Tax=Cohnella abietis TaxID=2507935 RepID=A0A3T1DDR9_9BACL|nr:DUF6612 family protein [Cohnella abietis]BBI36247.1 hypothetical protein KCTCHS21_56460 [Cohnella abietis]